MTHFNCKVHILTKIRFKRLENKISLKWFQIDLFRSVSILSMNPFRVLSNYEALPGKHRQFYFQIVTFCENICLISVKVILCNAEFSWEKPNKCNHSQIPSQQRKLTTTWEQKRAIKSNWKSEWKTLWNAKILVKKKPFLTFKANQSEFQVILIFTA